MSDRLEVNVREEGSSSIVGAAVKLWGWLREHFPLVTRSGAEYARAKVAQEQAKAQLISAQADEVSAKAEQIRVETQVRLSDLALRNRVVEAALRERYGDQEPDPTEALARIRAIIKEAQSLGMGLAIENMTGDESHLLSGSTDSADED